ncbi:MAG: AI-2E family transporter [bacterium]
MKNTTIFDIKFSALIKIFLFIALVWLTFQLFSLIIVVFIAFIIATAIRPIIKKLQDRKVPKTLSVGVIYMALISIISVLIYLIANPLAKELIDFGKNFPDYLTNAQNNIPFLSNFDIKGYTDNFATNFTKSGSGLAGNFSTALSALGGVFDIFTSTLTIIIVSIYLTTGLDKIIAALLKFVPKERREDVMRHYTKIEEQVGAWLRGQVFLMVLIGFLTYITLKILGIPYALPLAIFAGFMEILPIIGPLVYSVMIILVALTVSPLIAGLSAIACLIIQQLEGNVIVPAIMKKAVGLSPIITILAIIAGGSLLGVIGALLAVPITAIISALLQDIYAKE